MQNQFSKIFFLLSWCTCQHFSKNYFLVRQSFKGQLFHLFNFECVSFRSYTRFNQRSNQLYEIYSKCPTGNWSRQIYFPDVVQNDTVILLSYNLFSIMRFLHFCSRNSFVCFSEFIPGFSVSFSCILVFSIPLFGEYDNLNDQ